MSAAGCKFAVPRCTHLEAVDINKTDPDQIVVTLGVGTPTGMSRTARPTGRWKDPHSADPGATVGCGIEEATRTWGRVYQNVYHRDRPSSPAGRSGAVLSTTPCEPDYSTALDDTGLHQNRRSQRN